MHKIDAVDTPFPRYFDHCITGTGGKRMTIPGTLSQSARTSDMVAFCSSTLANSTGVRKSFANNTPGHHLASPPMMEGTDRWRPSKGDPANAAEVVVPGTSIPLGRYTGSIAVLYADGHVDTQGYNALHDMRKWANDATDVVFKHAQCGTTD
jgi:prepilin-type processing-associated H-X9-DG protein